MDLVINRVSGKTFVVLEDAGGAEFLAITPEGKIKRLKRHLFSALAGGGPNSLISFRKPNKNQMAVYAVYHGEQETVA